MSDWVSERSVEETLRFLDDVSGLASSKGGSLTRSLSSKYRRDRKSVV